MTQNEITELKKNGQRGPFLPEEYGTYTTEFGSFLKRHRCARAYLYELKRRQPDVALFFSCHIPENYFCCAFAYHKSIRGWNYWNEIEEMWTEELNNLKNKKS